MFRESLHFAPYVHWLGLETLHIGLQLEGVGAAVVVEVLNDDPARGAGQLNHPTSLDMDRVDNLL